MNQKTFKLSIVTTVFKSEKYLKEFNRRIQVEAKKITNHWEVIYVIDGSPDDSYEILKTLGGPLKIINLSRNIGHHKAIATGLKYATGDYIFLIDCDLEEPPEMLLPFWEKMHTASDIDVVYGVQKIRKGSFGEKFFGDLFYRLFNFVSDVQVPQNLIVIRLLKKKFLQNFLRFNEKEIMLGGLWALTGHRQEPFLVEKEDSGETTYNLKVKLKLLISSITSFSSKPLYFIFLTGLSVFAISLCYGSFILFSKIFFNWGTPGYASLIFSIWLLGGLTLLSLGIIGIYLSKMFVEIKNRPLALIESTVDHTEMKEYFYDKSSTTESSSASLLP